ncbi:hypothetical protein K437DRAFT_108565 [Tilletiaria anomala UBC 951]|uniref:Uncharacterized protein n=1 Tax=Tilletiaria anomala (strain ATCC 24038 / CBS 436.72 / UBC 951) TaxID=1037660 RepID=A0A066W151_TILAU|nr:uncharacterized protein K437DRAFT_108565 [Tilletiaria anomala UBC 951]KDN46268.1 hypothetical protein K437DRAFT_108565 [Tilletiaria anomala UBC 951]
MGDSRAVSKPSTSWQTSNQVKPGGATTRDQPGGPSLSLHRGNFADTTNCPRRTQSYYALMITAARPRHRSKTKDHISPCSTSWLLLSCPGRQTPQCTQLSVTGISKNLPQRKYSSPPRRSVAATTYSGQNKVHFHTLPHPRTSSLLNCYSTRSNRRYIEGPRAS